MAPTQTKPLPRIAHEEFCLPRPENDEPRLEQYTAIGDDSKGHERALTVTRCIECGAATYRPKD